MHQKFHLLSVKSFEAHEILMHLLKYAILFKSLDMVIVLFIDFTEIHQKFECIIIYSSLKMSQIMKFGNGFELKSISICSKGNYCTICRFYKDKQKFECIIIQGFLKLFQNNTTFGLVIKI